ncbi:helix-turn-helix transcriptional regulator [Candidatus Corynebacterium faecigallinarum]|uniref:helix-turn-helix transcriptional regulator n=1 Tax=Candidatus Corynebacterium faecigallinarum TaxID=2838528 RepID=UPI003FD3CA3D
MRIQGKQYLTMSETAETFGVTPTTVRRWVRAGEFVPPLKQGQASYWPATAIIRHLDKRGN